MIWLKENQDLPRPARPGEQPVAGRVSKRAAGRAAP